MGKCYSEIMHIRFIFSHNRAVGGLCDYIHCGGRTIPLKLNELHYCINTFSSILYHYVQLCHINHSNANNTRTRIAEHGMQRKVDVI